MAARSSRHGTARMAPRAAQEEPLDRRPVPRPSRDGAHEEELIESHPAMVFVAACESDLALQVERGDQAVIDDAVAHAGKELVEDVQDAGEQGVAGRMVLPAGLTQVVRRAAHLDRGQVAAGGRESGVVQGGHHHVQMGAGGRSAVLGGVARALEVVEVGRDHGVAGETPLRVLERRKPVEQQVQDRSGPPHPDVAHLAVELGAEPRRAHQAEEGAAGVGARHHAAGRDLFAVAQRHPGCGAVLDKNALDLGLRANLRPVRARRRGQRCGKRADPALQERRRAEAVGIAGGGVVDHAEGAAHRAGTLTGAGQGGGGEHSLERVAPEPVVEEVAGRERCHAQQLHDGAPPEPCGAGQRAQHADALPAGHVVQGGGRVVEGDAQDARHRAQMVGPVGEARRVSAAVAGDLVARPGEVPPQRERVPSAEQRGRDCGRSHPLQPVGAETEVGAEPCREESGVLSGHVDGAAGEDFRRRGCAPQELAAFQHEDLPPLAGEQCGRHQCVVTAAHNDRVVLLHLPLLPPDRLPRSAITRPAASLPGAPMIPPPGCVPDPHW